MTLPQSTHDPAPDGTSRTGAPVLYDDNESLLERTERQGRKKKIMGPRTYPQCREFGCGKYSQGKGFCRSHENIRTARGLPIGSLATIRREKEAINARLKANGLCVEVNAYGKLVSTDPDLVAAMGQADGSLEESGESGSGGPMRASAGNDNLCEEQPEFEEEDEEDEEEDEEEGETTIRMTRAPAPAPAVAVAPTTEPVGPQTRMRCVEEGCKRLNCKRNKFLCDTHHDQALLLERQIVTKRKRQADGSGPAADDSHEAAAKGHTSPVVALPSSSSSSSSSDMHIKQEEEQEQKQEQEREKGGKGRRKGVKLKASDTVNSLYEAELLQLAKSKRNHQGDNWVRPKHFTVALPPGQSMAAAEAEIEESKGAKSAKRSAAKALTEGSAGETKHNTGAVLSEDPPTGHPLPGQGFDTRIRSRVSGYTDPGLDFRTHSSQRPVGMGISANSPTTGASVAQAPPWASQGAGRAGNGASRRPGTSGSLGTTPPLRSSHTAPRSDRDSPTGRASRRSPWKTGSSAIGGTGVGGGPSSMDHVLGQRSLLCQVNRCYNEATTSMLCPQHHRVMFGANSVAPEVPRRVPLPLPPDVTPDPGAFVLHATFLKAQLKKHGGPDTR